MMKSGPCSAGSHLFTSCQGMRWRRRHSWPKSDSKINWSKLFDVWWRQCICGCWFAAVFKRIEVLCLRFLIYCKSSPSHCSVLFVNVLFSALNRPQMAVRVAPLSFCSQAAVYVTAQVLAGITADVKKRCRRYGRKRRTICLCSMRYVCVECQRIQVQTWNLSCVSVHSPL